MWGGGFDATGIVTSAHGIHSLGWFIRFVVRFMVALGCIPHNSKSTKILNLLLLARRSGSVVPIAVLGPEVGVRTPLFLGLRVFSMRGPGAQGHFWPFSFGPGGWACC